MHVSSSSYACILLLRSAIVQCVLIDPSGATKQAPSNSGEGGGGGGRGGGGGLGGGGGGLGGGGERADEIRAESQNLGREVEMVHISIAVGGREGGGGESEGGASEENVFSMSEGGASEENVFSSASEEYIVHSPGVYVYVRMCVCVGGGGVCVGVRACGCVGGSCVWVGVCTGGLGRGFVSISVKQPRLFFFENFT